MRNEAEVMGLRFAFLFMARVRQLHLSFLMLLFIGCYLLQHRAYFHRTEKNHSRSGTENAVAERERERDNFRFCGKLLSNANTCCLFSSLFRWCKPEHFRVWIWLDNYLHLTYKSEPMQGWWSEYLVCDDNDEDDDWTNFWVKLIPFNFQWFCGWWTSGGHLFLMDYYRSNPPPHVTVDDIYGHSNTCSCTLL